MKLAYNYKKKANKINTNMLVNYLIYLNLLNEISTFLLIQVFSHSGIIIVYNLME